MHGHVSFTMESLCRPVMEDDETNMRRDQKATRSITGLKRNAIRIQNKETRDNANAWD